MEPRRTLGLPRDMPVFVIAPPGRSRSRAITVAAIARDQGRQVIGVIPEDDDEIARHARFVLPVRGRVREEFSSLALPRLRLLPGVLHGYPARTAAVSSVTSRALTVASAYGLLLRLGLMADAAPA